VFCSIWLLSYVIIILLPETFDSIYFSTSIIDSLAAASRVIAVVSLAAHALQGCDYIGNVFDNAHNAPGELRLLVNELAIVERLVRDAPDADLHQEKLDFCNKRLSKPWQVVCKYGDLENARRRSKWGKRIAIAISTGKIQKNLGVLRAAKGYLESIQNVYCYHIPRYPHPHLPLLSSQSRTPKDHGQITRGP